MNQRLYCESKGRESVRVCYLFFPDTFTSFDKDNVEMLFFFSFLGTERERECKSDASRDKCMN